MANAICGRCGVLTHMSPIGAGNFVGEAGAAWIETSFRCDACRQLNIGGSWVTEVPRSWGNPEFVKDYWDRATPYEWFPKFVSGQAFHDVPEHIGGAASEAHKTYSIDAFKSSVLMARSVIEAVAKDKGVDEGNLVKKIDELHSQGLIKDFTKETAHMIRAFGNDMAHGDFMEPLDKEDAEGVLKFMDVLLREVYQDPAELQKLRAKAAARKKTGTP